MIMNIYFIILEVDFCLGLHMWFVFYKKKNPINYLNILMMIYIFRLKKDKRTNNNLQNIIQKTIIE